MIGQQVWEYSHQCDHAELREMLNGPRGKEPTVDEQLNLHRDLLVRFKCTLTSRGRSVNIKSASYKVLKNLLISRTLIHICAFISGH